MGRAILKPLRSCALIVGVIFTSTCLLAVPYAWAGGSSGGVHANPNSPAGNEYAIPLSKATPPHRKQRTPVYVPVVAPAVKHHHRRHHHKRVHRTAHHRAHRAAILASQRPDGTPGAGALLAGGGSPWWLMLALAGGVGVIRAGAGIAARRLTTA